MINLNAFAPQTLPEAQQAVATALAALNSVPCNSGMALRDSIFGKEFTSDNPPPPINLQSPQYLSDPGIQAKTAETQCHKAVYGFWVLGPNGPQHAVDMPPISAQDYIQPGSYIYHYNSDGTYTLEFIPQPGSLNWDQYLASWKNAQFQMTTFPYPPV